MISRNLNPCFNRRMSHSCHLENVTCALLQCLSLSFFKVDWRFHFPASFIYIKIFQHGELLCAAGILVSEGAPQAPLPDCLSYSWWLPHELKWQVSGQRENCLRAVLTTALCCDSWRWMPGGLCRGKAEGYEVKLPMLEWALLHEVQYRTSHTLSSWVCFQKLHCKYAYNVKRDTFVITLWNITG